MKTSLRPIVSLLVGVMVSLLDGGVVWSESLKRYEGKMVSFSYPPEWKVQPSLLGGLEFSVSIENDESAILFITFHEQSDNKTLQEIIQEDQNETSGMPITFTAGTLSEVQRPIAGKNAPGKRREYSVTMRGDILSLSRSKMRKEYYLIDCKPRSVEIAAQASVDEWPALDRMFETVSQTLELRCR